MAQITLTFDLTPKNVETLHKIALELSKPAKIINNTDDLEAPAEKNTTKATAGKPKTGASKKETKATDEKSIGLTEVRAVALKLSQAGKQSTLQSIFANFGAKKLSDIPQEEYPALMEELEAAANE